MAVFGAIAALTFAAPAHADDDALGPTAQQDCTALSWPQPLPNAVGRQLEEIVNDDSFWICLNIAAIAPDDRPRALRALGRRDHRVDFSRR